MAEILATKTSRAGCEGPGTFEAARAGALFVSTLQCSQRPAADEVRRAVAISIRKLGIRGCAVQVAGEFGDHPDSAVARMSWALATIQAVYPAPPRTAAPDRRPLAFAS